MCGIVGFCKNTPDVNQEYLKYSLKLLDHRGPDDHGVFIEEDQLIGLAHTRLSILDLSLLGHQPMIDETDRYVLVYNGEIYNFNAIKKELKGLYTFKSNSDSEVVLYTYIHYGVGFLEKLNGIFALAIYDKHTQEILIARDRFGIKPLYYTVTSSGFYFTSELKTLMTLDDIDIELDFKGIENYLSYLWSPTPRTPLKSVKKLESGTYLIVKNGKILKQELFYEDTYHEDETKSFEDIQEQLDKKLEDAVHRQMISDVPIGAFLSGGLDSSSIVAYARKFTGASFPTFTINAKHDLGMADDFYYSKKVAKHLNVDLHPIDISHEMFFDLENMIYYLDEPQADLAPLLVSYISKIAREKYGIKVLLSGAGGDDIFSGYRRHYALRIDEKISKIPNVLRSTAKDIIQKLPSQNSFLRRLKKYTRYFDLDGNEKIISYFHWIDESSRRKLFSKDVYNQLKEDNYSSNELLNKELDKLGSSTSSLNKMLQLDKKFFLTDHNLNYTDKMGMKESVEIRVPLLDNELVNYASTIPNKLKQNGKEGKYIFKKVMENYLPKEVIYRPKTGFGTPLKSWIHKELKEYIDTILSEENINKRGIFNYQAVQTMIYEDKIGKEDYSYIILSILSIEIWCQIFIDNKEKLKAI